MGEVVAVNILVLLMSWFTDNSGSSPARCKAEHYYLSFIGKDTKIEGLNDLTKSRESFRS